MSLEVDFPQSPGKSQGQTKAWWQSCETLSRETSNTCQSQALWDSKWLLFQAATFVVICYCRNKLTMGTLFQEHCKRGFPAGSFWAQGKPALVWASWPVWGLLSLSLSILIIALLSLEWTGTATPETHQVTLLRTSASFQDPDTYILYEALICSQAERVSPPSPVVHKAMEKSAHWAEFPESGLLVARAHHGLNR